ncbi:MAG: metal/formaldehyde-sensitive transcriptional repressor [Bacteriovoracaceae bacterium]|jgi:DNA-binding FrmR family transcriptional regulator|nr:metal/formaldehyde-sensitive transcriptional repressor [Bacteriovoracaceae bacterium]
MPHSIQEKKKAITRLRRIRGQAESLERAIEAGTDCSTLLQQIAALRGATNSLMSEVLQGHLRETFDHKGKEISAKEMQLILDDMLTLVRTYLK